MLANEHCALGSDFGEDLSRCSDLQGWAADPKAAAQLQLLASSHVVDLETITNVIGSDVGLSVELLQLAARKGGKHAARMSTLSEVIVHLGLEQLRTMAAQVTLTAANPRRA